MIQFPRGDQVRNRECKSRASLKNVLAMGLSNKVQGSRAQGPGGALERACLLSGLFTERLLCSTNCSKENQFPGQAK